MADEKISLQSKAGITRYFDEYKSKIEIKPGHVIIMCIVVMLIILFLHKFGFSWLGVVTP